MIDLPMDAQPAGMSRDRPVRADCATRGSDIGRADMFCGIHVSMILQHVLSSPGTGAAPIGQASVACPGKSTHRRHSHNRGVNGDAFLVRHLSTTP
jgi:hypothetical protein